MERDRDLFARIFENRVMSVKQIGTEVFPRVAQQTISRRLIKLIQNGFLERRVVIDPVGGRMSIYLNTPKAIKELTGVYRHRISKELCKSDSVDHDLRLVDLRRRIRSFGCVANYLTENMLQACGEFADSEVLEPFVRNNTDGVIEILKNGKKITIGLEFEKSEKASERYTRKLVSYYSDYRTPIIFYICSTPRIRDVVANVESAVVGKNRPRCFFALAEDVLLSDRSCTFKNSKGDTITLT